MYKQNVLEIKYILNPIIKKEGAILSRTLAFSLTGVKDTLGALVLHVGVRQRRQKKLA